MYTDNKNIADNLLPQQERARTNDPDQERYAGFVKDIKILTETIEFTNAPHLINNENKRTLALMSFRNACNIQELVYSWYKGIDNNLLNANFPNRLNDITNPISQAQIKMLDFIDTGELTRNETETFVEKTIEKATNTPGVHPGWMCNYDKEQNYYYVKPMMIGGPSGVSEPTILEALYKNPDMQLNESDIEEILDYQNNIHKIHVNISPDKRYEFLLRLFQERARTLELSRSLSAEKGIGYKLSYDDLKAKGATIMGLGTFKFAGFENIRRKDRNGDEVADFIFYIPKYKGAKEQLQFLQDGISQIVRDFESDDPKPSRYSRFVEGPDGYKHTSLCTTQGDGDFKAWLKTNNLLDRYYDADSNYSRRKIEK